MHAADISRLSYLLLFASNVVSTLKGWHRRSDTPGLADPERFYKSCLVIEVRETRKVHCVEWSCSRTVEESGATCRQQKLLMNPMNPMNPEIVITYFDDSICFLPALEPTQPDTSRSRWGGCCLLLSSPP